jgi:lambda repressor-like predicted transcriptional regulator
MNAPYRKKRGENHSTAVRRTDAQLRAVPEAGKRLSLVANIIGRGNYARWPRDVDPFLVIAAVHLLGTSLAKLSRQHGFNRNAFQQALQGTRPNRKVEALLASFLGLETWVLWPERYPAKRAKAPRAKVAA